MSSLADSPPLTHRQLSLFRAIMLHGSLSRAAEACETSQPTLSRELARLEALLNFALFDRVRGRLRPTVRAQLLMQEVERSFIGLENIAACAQALRTQTTGQLHVACVPALAHSLMPRALAHLQQIQPSIAINIQPMESPWLEQALSEQRFDLGLTEANLAPIGTTLRSLLDVNEVAVLHSNHPLTRKKILSLQDFANERFISLAPEDNCRKEIDRLFVKAGIERQLLMETASAVAVCGMVQHGLGISIVNPLTALALTGTTLTVRPLTEAIPFRIGMLLPQIVAPHPLRQFVVDAIAHAARDIEKAISHGQLSA